MIQRRPHNVRLLRVMASLRSFPSSLKTRLPPAPCCPLPSFYPILANGVGLIFEPCGECRVKLGDSHIPLGSRLRGSDGRHRESAEVLTAVRGCCKRDAAAFPLTFLGSRDHNLP